MSNIQATGLVVIGFVLCLFINNGLVWLAWVAFVIYALVRPEANGGRPAAAAPSVPLDSREQRYLDDLRQAIAGSSDPEERRGLERALQLAEADWLPVAAPVPVSVKPASVPVSRPAQPSAWQRWRAQTDQTAMLLYVGSFLFIVAASLFLAYANVSSGFKCAVLLLMTALFYLGGLALAARSRLRPAAVMFVVIGVLLVPISGLAIGNLLAVAAGTSWLLTSLVGSLLYLVASLRLQSSSLGQLTTLMWVSLAVSSAYVLDAPLYGYVWMLIVVGIGLHGLRRFVPPQMAVMATPSQQTGQLLVPLAALVGLCLTSEALPLWQSGVSLLLAAAYYGLLAAEATRASSRNLYAIVAHLTVVAAISALFFDLVGDLQLLGLLLSLLALAHVGWLYRIARRPLFADGYDYAETMYGLASGLAIAGGLCLLGDAYLLSFGLVVSIIVHSLLYRLWRGQLYAPLAAAASLLLLPLSIGAMVGQAAYRPELVAVSYVGAAGVTLLARRGLAQAGLVRIVAQVTCLALLAIAWLVSLSSANWWALAGLQLVLLLATEVVGRYEHWQRLSLVGPLLLATALITVLTSPVFGLSLAVGMVFTLLVSSCYSYIYARLTSSHLRRVALLGWTFGLGLLAWVAAQAVEPAFVGPVILLLFAWLGLYELRQRPYLWRELRTLPAAAAVLAVLQFTIDYVALLDPAVYMTLWALFALGCAVWLEQYQRPWARLYALAAAIVVLGAAATMSLHLVVGQGGPVLAQAYVVLLALAGLFGLSYAARQLASGSVVGYQALYWAALAAVVLLLQVQPNAWLTVTGTGLAALLIWRLNQRDQQPAAVVLVPMLLALTAHAGFGHIFDYSSGEAAARSSMAAGLGAGLGYLILRLYRADETRGRYLLLATTVLALAGWVSAWGIATESPLRLVGPSLLAFAAVTILAENRLLRLTPLQTLLPLALAVVALQELVDQAYPGMTWLVYSHLWTGYLAYAAWQLQRQRHPRRALVVTVLALLTFSVPLTIEALASPAGFGIVLLAEHTALLVLGVYLRRPLLVYWAVVVSVLSVMYLLRSFAYVQVGLIAVLLIGYGVYRLGKTGPGKG